MVDPALSAALTALDLPPATAAQRMAGYDATVWRVELADGRTVAVRMLRPGCRLRASSPPCALAAEHGHPVPEVVATARRDGPRRRRDVVVPGPDDRRPARWPAAIPTTLGQLLGRPRRACTSAGRRRIGAVPSRLPAVQRPGLEAAGDRHRRLGQRAGRRPPRRISPGRGSCSAFAPGADARISPPVSTSSPPPGEPGTRSSPDARRRRTRPVPRRRGTAAADQLAAARRRPASAHRPSSMRARGPRPALAAVTGSVRILSSIEPGDGASTQRTITGMNRALLVIDVQESFRSRPTDWSEMHNPDIAKQVTRLVDAARDAGDLVVWVLHAEPGSDTVFDPDAGHVRLLDELEPDDEEPVVVKTSINAFTTTNLQQQLVQHGVREVVICGIRTEQCCETTARVAAISASTSPSSPMPRRLPASTGSRPQDIIERTDTRARSARVRHASPRPTNWWPRWHDDRIVTTVVFVLVPGVHLLDFAGPAQVFSGGERRRDYDLRYVAAAARPSTPPRTCRCRPRPRCHRSSVDDLLVVPGWRGERLADPVPIPDFVLSALVEHHARGGTVASVCAGAEALGRAGLLDGRRCTTHHEHQDELAARYPRAQVVRDVLFTEDDAGRDVRGHRQRDRSRAASGGARGTGRPLAARIAREMVDLHPAQRRGRAGERDAAAPRAPVRSGAPRPGVDRRPVRPHRCGWPSWPPRSASASAR